MVIWSQSGPSFHPVSIMVQYNCGTYISKEAKSIKYKQKIGPQVKVIWSQSPLFHSTKISFQKLGQTTSRHTSILALYFTQQVSWTIPNLSLAMTIKNKKVINLTNILVQNQSQNLMCILTLGTFYKELRFRNSIIWRFLLTLLSGAKSTEIFSFRTNHGLCNCFI